VSDGEGPRKPDRVRIGDFTLLVIERGGRLALRLYDRLAPTFTGFRGLEHFPLSPRHRICARFSPYPEPRTIAVGTAIGTSEQATIPGEVAFELDGAVRTLLPIAEEDGLFFVFADATNGVTSYGGGRFLMAGPPDASGQVELDFNKAQNPPCAFTPYATCPRPPRENRLPIAIEAGEIAYSGRH
jgi:uncharacterized protein (DUF1684 family)